MKPIREVKLTNTLTGQKEVLTTWNPGKLTLYSCGPTVYDLVHIGNLRASMTADLFFRYFKKIGYAVTYVRNYTDVDDRIITKANQLKTDTLSVTRKYISEVELDFAAGGLQEPTHKTLVTEHMPEIIAMIERIVENGKGYVVDGEVFFAIEEADHYGKLSHKKVEDLDAGHRVEVSSKKRNPLDFTLWKPAKPGEPSWQSPWGPGRPGWHIECSAMAGKWLGDQIDVHHGGMDLIFPHHENEIAQSEAASGKAPYVRYWLHNAFLTLRKDKMSKSLGNVFQAREFLTRFGTEMARYMLMSAHYRSALDFGPETLDNAYQGLSRIYEAKKIAQELIQLARARADMRAESVWGEFVATCDQTRVQIDDALANDFQTPAALGALFTMVREFNRAVAEPLARATPGAVLGAQALIAILDQEIQPIFGFGGLDAETALGKLSQIQWGTERSDGPSPELVEGKIAERASAKAAKDYARADAIRKELEAMGVVLKDSPTGTTWSMTHRGA